MLKVLGNYRARRQAPAAVHSAGDTAHNRGMNLIAIVLGILAALVVIVTAIVPVIGAIFAWLALIVGVVGLIFGLLSNRTTGRNICILACVLAGLRLAVGIGFV